MSIQTAKLLVVYVPISAVESVKAAVFSAGGGVIGAYSHCAWQTVGQGQFLPSQSANPAVGSMGVCEKLEEVKVEILCDQTVVNAVSNAIYHHHPYEEPVFFFLDLAGTEVAT